LGDTVREATSVEVEELKKENEQFKQLVAELSLKNRVLKKVQLVWNRDRALYAIFPIWKRWKSSDS